MKEYWIEDLDGAGAYCGYTSREDAEKAAERITANGGRVGRIIEVDYSKED